MKRVIRRLYDVSLPLLTPMHYVHLVHACVFGKWIDSRADSGIRRINIIATYMAGAAIWRGRVALAWFSAQLQLESSRPVTATVLASITALMTPQVTHAQGTVIATTAMAWNADLKDGQTAADNVFDVDAPYQRHIIIVQRDWTFFDGGRRLSLPGHGDVRHGAVGRVRSVLAGC